MIQKNYPTWPLFDDDEIEAVTRILRSGNVNYWSGTEGKKFENEFSELCGCKYAVALANGTVALEVALYALGIGPGDEVIVTSRSFIASVSCIVMRGATPVMVDVDRDSQNITATSIKAALSIKTKAIIVVHLAGWPCDMKPIMDLATENNLKVIEDCAQAHGAKYEGKPVGSFGHVAAFSFCQDKIISTGGEGGMLTTNDYEVWEKSWSIKDHGKGYDVVFNQPHPPGYKWLHERFGTNLRLTEIQSSIGRLAIRKLPRWVDQRRKYARIFNDFFSQYEFFRVTQPDKNFYHSYYKYYVFVRPNKLENGWDRDRIMLEISSRGVPCFNTYSGEVYLDGAFEVTGLRPERRLLNSRELGENCLQFLVHPTLKEEDINDMCEEIGQAISTIG